jgi:transposase-like protein
VQYTIIIQAGDVVVSAKTFSFLDLIKSHIMPLLDEYKVTPDSTTWGCLAKTINNKDEADEFIVSILVRFHKLSKSDSILFQKKCPQLTKTAQDRNELLSKAFNQFMFNAQQRPANYEYAHWILGIMMENSVTPNEEFVYHLDRFIQRRREHLMRQCDETTMKEVKKLDELSKLRDQFKRHFNL